MIREYLTRLRFLLFPKKQGELDDELRFHLEQSVEKKMAAGLSAAEARRKSLIEFGGVERTREQCDQQRPIQWMSGVVQDIRYGFRVLLKAPGFTLVVVLTLALGIGANTAIFTLVNAVMLRSIPVKDPQQLVVPEWAARNWPRGLNDVSSFGDCADVDSAHSDCSFSYPMFHEMREQKNVFANAMAFAGPAQLDLSGNGAAAVARGELVSGSYFDTLEVGAALGRTLNPEDEKSGAAPVAVLDYAYWQRVFGGSPGAIGRTIRLNHAVFTIVGVADQDFTRLTPGKSVDLWVPLNQATPLGLPWASKSNSNAWSLVVVGRLRTGVSRTRAQAAMNALFLNETMRGAKPQWTAADDPHLELLPAQQGLTGIRTQYGEPLLLLMAAVGLVLLIACANVAGLMLSRGTAREREMAVRLAVGAGRGRVMRQLLTESLLLSFVGAAFGTLLAYAGATGLAAFFSENAYEPLRLNLHPNTTVLLFTLGAAFLTGVGFGIAPAFRGSRANVIAELKGNTATSTGRGGGNRTSLGKGLVVIQIALSMIVLTGAGLLLRTLENLRHIDPGFDIHNILLFSIDPESAGYKKEQISAFYAELQRRFTALPGVVNATYSSNGLLTGGLSGDDLHIEGRTDKTPVQSLMLSVGSNFFETMKIPLLEGRFLRAGDIGSTQLQAVVNREFVRKFMDGQNPIGVHFRDTDQKSPQWEIVGVVGDTKYATLRHAMEPIAYLPLTTRGATFTLRTAFAPSALMLSVRNLVNKMDSNLPILWMETQSDSIDRLLFNERLVARLFGLFGALGLILAGIGLYGLLSYEVARRTREIGIRTALGAQRRHVLAPVLRQGLILVTLGAAGGAGIAMGVTRLLHSLLYAVRPSDPITFVLVAGLLIAVGMLACLLPAIRATRVDPMTALRCE